MLTLQPLTDAEYAAFAEQQVAEYAHQHVAAGEWSPDVAMNLSRAEQSALLADLHRGNGHDFLKAIDASGELVGWLWIAPAPPFLGEPRDHKRWLAQITIAEARRRQGLGRAVLEAMHARLAAEGVEEIWLRVYDWNIVARRLYVSAGYEVARQFSTDAHMRRPLLPGSSH